MRNAQNCALCSPAPRSADVGPTPPIRHALPRRGPPALALPPARRPSGVRGWQSADQPPVPWTRAPPAAAWPPPAAPITHSLTASEASERPGSPRARRIARLAARPSSVVCVRLPQAALPKLRSAILVESKISSTPSTGLEKSIAEGKIFVSCSLNHRSKGSWDAAKPALPFTGSSPSM